LEFLKYPVQANYDLYLNQSDVAFWVIEDNSTLLEAVLKFHSMIDLMKRKDCHYISNCPFEKEQLKFHSQMKAFSYGQGPAFS